MRALVAGLLTTFLWSCTSPSGTNPSHVAAIESSDPEAYERALGLIHAYNGAGTELKRAMELADALSVSHPGGGYSQTLQAEALSTWQLEQDGTPENVRRHIIDLTEQSLRLNPKLAQAYVARARALLRASLYEQASEAIDASLKLKPNLNGAFFLRAELFRRTFRPADAEIWYLKFIEAIPDLPRKSNGYYWLGKSYQQAAYLEPEPTRQAALIAKARTAYQSMVELDPTGPWKNVNFAVFLNNDAADFNAAERYAQKALAIMDFPMARYHLAIARYQKLLAPAGTMDREGLQQAIQQVYGSTGVSFDDAIEFSACCSGISSRLRTLRARLASDGK